MCSTNMLPAEKAAAVYAQEPCAQSFREDLEAHLLISYVFSTPELNEIPGNTFCKHGVLFGVCK